MSVLTEAVKHTDLGLMKAGMGIFGIFMKTTCRDGVPAAGITACMTGGMHGGGSQAVSGISIRARFTLIPIHISRLLWSFPSRVQHPLQRRSIGTIVRILQDIIRM